MARRRISRLAGWILPILAFLLLARFHKWYVWLFPMAALYCFDRSLDDDESNVNWWAVGGFIGGIGALFRLDYGIASFLLYTILALAPKVTSRSDGEFWQRRWLAYVTLFSIPLSVWLAVLGAKGGFGAIAHYFHATVSGGVGAIVDWSLPLPEMSVSDPFSVESAHAMALILMPLTYAFCIGVGGWRGYLRPTGDARDWRFVAAVGLLGMAIFPHGVYRADLSHLLQIIPPMLLASAVPLSRGYRSLRGEDRILSVPGRRVLLAALAAYAILLTLTLPLTSNPQSDLAPLASDPIGRYRELAGELSAAQDIPPREAQIASLIVEMTTPEDPILVIPFAPQIYYFSRRPMSGHLNTYYFAGVHDDEISRRRNLEHVFRNPPALVVAPANLLRMKPDRSFRRSQPELYDYLASRYTDEVARYGRWILLALENE
jgi:hypothetical protein